LEEFEPRCTPTGFSWSGLGGDGQSTTPANWYGGRPTDYPGINGNQDSADFPAGPAADYTVQVSGITIGKLTIEGPHLNLELGGDLTVDGTGVNVKRFSMTAGKLSALAGLTNAPSLVLSNLPAAVNSTWSGGTIGDDASQIDLHIFKSSWLQITNANGTPTMNGNISIGETSGTTTQCELDMKGDLTLGSSPSITHNVTVGPGGALGRRSLWYFLSPSKVLGGNAATDDQVTVDGLLSVRVPGSSVSTSRIALPIVVSGSLGDLDIESNNKLTVNGGPSGCNTYPWAVKITGDVGATGSLDVGYKNPGDTADGYATLDCDAVLGSASVLVDGGCTASFYGLSDTLNMHNGTGPWRLLVNGTLSLAISRGAFEITNLNVANGNVEFSSSSTYSFWVNANSTPPAATN
jgi:hypothetical protein